jgi:hypothetical protein
MKNLSKVQLISLWICAIYLGFAFVRIGTRAAWGFLRIASEYKEELVPRDVLLGIVEDASNDFWHFTLLVGIAFLFLLSNVLWLTFSSAGKNRSIRSNALSRRREDRGFT